MFSSTLLWKGQIMFHTKGQGIQEGLQLHLYRGTTFLQITFLNIKEEGVGGTYTLQSLLQPSSVGDCSLCYLRYGYQYSHNCRQLRESRQSRLKSRVTAQEVSPFGAPITDLVSDLIPHGRGCNGKSEATHILCFTSCCLFSESPSSLLK